MDRIRKALDLARQERNRHSQPQLDPSRSSDARVQSGAAPAIIYSATRVFTPKPAVLETNRILDPAGKHPAAAAFRMLRTQVLQKMHENNFRSLAVLSPAAADGKTTTAVNLAISLAGDQCHTVLLVDCDLQRPAVSHALDLQPEYGIDDVLSGDAHVGQCLYHPEGFERLVVLPARSALANSSAALAGPKGRALILELRERYSERIVVFDLPAVLDADDALAFLPLVECGLVVVAERTTRRDALLRCMELLHKTPIVGVVLNGALDSGSSIHG